MRTIIPLIALLFVSPWAFAQDGKGEITVEADGKCTTTTAAIDCNGKCGNGKNVWWDVENKNAKDAVVALVQFKHVDTGWYIDPMVGPGNDGIHAIDVKTAKTETLKLKVRKMEYFLGPYDYKVAVRFDGGANFAICLDPRIDIGN